jgi:hypothetical protein
MASVQQIRQKMISLVLGDKDVDPVDLTHTELSTMFLIYAKSVGFDQAKMRRAYMKLSNNNPQAVRLARAWYAEAVSFSNLVTKIVP